MSPEPSARYRPEASFMGPVLKLDFSLDVFGGREERERVARFCSF